MTFLQRTVLKSEEKLKNLSNVEDPNSMASAYEQLLQKAEIKIRDLIRVSNIYNSMIETFVE